jgi:hypothetical protein
MPFVRSESTPRERAATTAVWAASVVLIAPVTSSTTESAWYGRPR